MFTHHLLHNKVKTVMAEPRLLRFFIVVFLWAIANGMLIFYVPIHIESKMGDLFWVGMMLAASNLASLGTDLVFGFVNQMTNYRRFLYLGLLLSIVQIPLLIWGGHWIVFLIVMIVWGVGWEMFAAFGVTLFLARHSPPGKYASVSGFNLAMRNAGYFIGPILGDYLRLNSPVMFWVVLTGMFVLCLAYMFVTITPSLGDEFQHKVKHLDFVSELKIMRRYFRHVLPFCVLGFSLSFFESLFVIFGPVHFAFTTSISGLISGMAAFAYMLAPPVAAILLLRGRYRSIMLMAVVFVVFGSVLFGYTADPLVILALTFGIFSMSATIFVAADGIFLKFLASIRDDEEDEIISLNSFSMNLAYAVMGVVGAALVASIGFTNAMLVSALVFGVGVLVFLTTPTRQ